MTAPATDLRSAAAFASASPLGATFAQHLAERIIAGHHQAGERLTEMRLAAEYGISRSPVREGLRILANEGLVLLVERRGAIVKPLTREDIEEAFACRMALQGLAARLAAEGWQEPDLAALRHILARMEQAVAVGDVEAYFSADIAYHDEIGRLGRNQRLRALLSTLGREMLRLRFLINQIEGRQRESIVYNRDILAAIEARDAEQAERLTRALTWSGCERLLDTLHLNGL